MTTARKYAVGDRVIHRRWATDRAGEVTKSAPVYPLVRWDGQKHAERTRADELRPETAMDVAAREHTHAMEAWRLARPKTAIAQVEYDSRWGHARDELGACFLRCRTPAEMRTAADELRLLADWFEQRPKEQP